MRNLRARLASLRLYSPLSASSRLYSPLLASTRLYSPRHTRHLPPSGLGHLLAHRSTDRRVVDVRTEFRSRFALASLRKSPIADTLDACVTTDRRERRRAVGRDSRSRSSKRAAGERRRTARREIYRGELSRGSVACSEKSRLARRRATAWRGPSRRRGTSLETGETYLLRAIFRSRVVKQQKIINHRDF